MMKNFFYILAVLPLFLVSCSKEEGTNSNIDYLVGTWLEYAMYIENPIGGGNSYWAPSDFFGKNPKYIEFRKDYTYKKWEEDSEGNIKKYTEKTGSYKIDEDKISFDGGFWKGLTFGESYQMLEIEKYYRYKKK